MKSIVNDFHEYQWKSTLLISTFLKMKNKLKQLMYQKPVYNCYIQIPFSSLSPFQFNSFVLYLLCLKTVKNEIKKSNLEVK